MMTLNSKKMQIKDAQSTRNKNMLTGETLLKCVHLQLFVANYQLSSI